MDSLYSPSWYHVADLRPRLNANLRFHRHGCRGEDWYVVQNPTSGRVHRLTPSAHALVARMDGRATTQEIWDAALTAFGDDAPTQSETLSLIGQLVQADVLRCDVPADTAELFRREQEREDRERRSHLNPISFRVPLFDPDAFLTRASRWVAPLFSRTGLALWSFIVAIAAVLALKNAPELAAGARSILEPESLVALWFAYPVVKALHELGHAFAVKRWGGEVHEIGVLFLVFMPVPYVDASASSVFVQKRRRMVVGAAGIAVELFLAAVALCVWLAVEPGWVRHVAYAVMVVGGVSTLAFNGNPLLRFDGYYVLSDWLEIPNLGAKSNRVMGALAKRFLLGLRDVELPETTPRETPWLVGYAIASFVYRVGVLFGIALYLASDFFVVGIVLAAVTVVLRLVVPLLRQVGYILTDPTLGERRARVVTRSLVLASFVGMLLFVLPLPVRTTADGVIWLPEEAHVRASADGFVEAVLATPHSQVESGQPLIQIRDPAIEARVLSLQARVEELRQRLFALDPLDRVASDGLRSEVEGAEAELKHARERMGEVRMRSPTGGVFVVADGRDLLGRYVRQGDVVGFVVDQTATTARVVVGQEDAAMLRDETNAAWLRVEHDLGTVLPVEIAREVPAATNALPTAAFGTAGGGSFAVDPMDPDGRTSLEPVFQFDLALPGEGVIAAAGERVHVRFDHPSEPVAARAYRSLRRLFLRQLGV